jgi:hypothetical protein
MSVALSRLLHVHHAGQIGRARRRLRRRLGRTAAGWVVATSLGAAGLALAGPPAAALAPSARAQIAAAGPSGGPSAKGPAYWLAGSDGGVFAFADAGYAGGLAGARLNAPIVAMAATPDGAGYWLVGRDGGVFTFGDAGFFGGLSGARLNAPIVAMAATPDGAGYWLAGADGGVFTFGRAAYLGGLSGQHLKGHIVAVAPTWDGAGYWLVGSDGGVFAFGDAGAYGSLGGTTLNRPVVALAAGLGPAHPAAPPRLLGTTGFDVSWPQCPAQVPGTHAFGVVGVTGGQAFTVNPCLLPEYQWALSGAAAGVYVNLSPVTPGLREAIIGPAGVCLPVNLACQGRNYGANTVLAAVAAARAAGADRAPVWWLDVETENQWPADAGLNRAVVLGAIDEVSALGHQAGVYSTAYQWSLITGGFRPHVPVWLAGAADMGAAASWCADHSLSFTGGPVWLVQTLPGRFDQDLACPAAVARSEDLFSYPSLAPVPVIATGPGGSASPSTTAPVPADGGPARPDSRRPGTANGDRQLVEMLAEIAGNGRSAGAL